MCFSHSIDSSGYPDDFILGDEWFVQPVFQPLDSHSLTPMVTRLPSLFFLGFAGG